MYEGHRSVFEDFGQRHHDLRAGNAQHPILQRRALLGGVQVAFERFRIDHPDIRRTRFQDGLDFAIDPKRTVLRREDLNPEEWRRLQDGARGFWTFQYTQVRNHVFPCPRADPRLGADVEIPGFAPPEEIRAQRRLEFRVMPGSQVSLDQHAVFEFAVRLVGGVQVFFLGDQNPSCHDLRIPLQVSEKSGRDGQIRTADLSLRRRPLYPSELRPHSYRLYL